MTEREHEKCAGCGREAWLTPGTPKGTGYVRCSTSFCFVGPRRPTEAAAWSEWDRVMRAARELAEVRAALKRAVDNCDRIVAERDAAIAAEREREAKEAKDE